MNWNYISGFFDADGSVSYTYPRKGKNKTAQVSFHNTEMSILNKIKSFIDSEIGVKGSIVTKKPRSENHIISYDLKYKFRSAIEVLKRLDIRHPKKRQRKNLLLQIQKIKPRNGKYKPIQIEKIEKLESQWK